VEIAVLTACVFLWPAAILTVALGDSVTALTPGNLLRVVTVSIGPYLKLWAATVVVVGLIGAAGWVTTYGLRQANVCPAVGLLIMLLLVSVAGLVVMRVIGLTYRHFKDKLPFVAE
jgi:hypothetical protein